MKNNYLRILLASKNSPWGVLKDGLGNQYYQYIVDFPDDVNDKNKFEFINDELFDGKNFLELFNNKQYPLSYISSNTASVKINISDYENLSMFDALRKDCLLVEQNIYNADKKDYDKKIILYACEGKKVGPFLVEYELVNDWLFNEGVNNLFRDDRKTLVKRAHVNNILNGNPNILNTSLNAFPEDVSNGIVVDNLLLDKVYLPDEKIKWNFIFDKNKLPSQTEQDEAKEWWLSNYNNNYLVQTTPSRENIAGLTGFADCINNRDNKLFIDSSYNSNITQIPNNSASVDGSVDRFNTNNQDGLLTINVGTMVLWDRPVANVSTPNNPFDFKGLKLSMFTKYLEQSEQLLSIKKNLNQVFIPGAEYDVYVSKQEDFGKEVHPFSSVAYKVVNKKTINHKEYFTVPVTAKFSIDAKALTYTIDVMLFKTLNQSKLNYHIDPEDKTPFSSQFAAFAYINGTTEKDIVYRDNKPNPFIPYSVVKLLSNPYMSVNFSTITGLRIPIDITWLIGNNNWNNLDLALYYVQSINPATNHVMYKPVITDRNSYKYLRTNNYNKTVYEDNNNLELTIVKDDYSKLLNTKGNAIDIQAAYNTHNMELTNKQIELNKARYGFGVAKDTLNSIIMTTFNPVLGINKMLGTGIDAGLNSEGTSLENQKLKLTAEYEIQKLNASILDTKNSGASILGGSGDLLGWLVQSNMGNDVFYNLEVEKFTPALTINTLSDNQLISLSNYFHMFGSNVANLPLNINDFIDNKYFFNYLETQSLFENYKEKYPMTNQVRQVIDKSFANGIFIFHYRDKKTWPGLKNFDVNNADNDRAIIE